MKIILLNPDSLEILSEWTTDSENKKRYGHLIMIDEILYATNKYNESPT